MSEVNMEPSENSEGIREFNGAKDFYENSGISDLNGTGETVLASCSAGLERSNVFNTLIPETGVLVPRIKPGSVNDPEFPINHSGNGIALNEMLDLITDSKLEEDGLHLKYFDKPVNHLVLITGGSTLPMVDKVKGILRGMSEGHKTKFGVDVLLENDVKNFENKTREFVSSKKM